VFRHPKRAARRAIPWRRDASIRWCASAACVCSLAFTLEGHSVSAQAANVHKLSLRYGASGWRF
jgi:hypothetical protein